MINSNSCLQTIPTPAELRLWCTPDSRDSESLENQNREQEMGEKSIKTPRIFWENNGLIRCYLNAQSQGIKRRRNPWSKRVNGNNERQFADKWGKEQQNKKGAELLGKRRKEEEEAPGVLKLTPFVKSRGSIEIFRGIIAGKRHKCCWELPWIRKSGE